MAELFLKNEIWFCTSPQIFLLLFPSSGQVFIGLGLIAIPQATNLYELILPMGFMGIAIGMVESSMMPHLGYLVDLRHVGVYGNIYAVGDISFCLAFAIGPIVAGPIVQTGIFLKLFSIFLSEELTQLANHRAEICCHTFQKSVLKLIIGVSHIFFHITISIKIVENDNKYHYRKKILTIFNNVCHKMLTFPPGE